MFAKCNRTAMSGKQYVHLKSNINTYITQVVIESRVQVFLEYVPFYKIEGIMYLYLRITYIDYALISTRFNPLVKLGSISCNLDVGSMC